ncbi:BQ2448_1892 [Microbotryum intermedium]|uniref:BQ2448_1892 protein n=1 Tax=Microbotryum intermedium TaxID=269621 RepID=A0A238FH77_9BASI|nr:BQ2448_1892 [Microbotryum intermedium]
MSSPAKARSPFRPTPRTTFGARASLSALPSTSTTTMNKENRRSTSSTSMMNVAAFGQQAESVAGMPAAQHSKKRAHSLGGEALEQATKRAKDWDVLSPGKQARRRAVPRKSVLRAIPAIFDPVPPESSLYSVQLTKQAASHTTDLSSLSTFGQANAAATNRRRSSVHPQGNTREEGESGEDDDEEEGSGSMDMELTRTEGQTTAFLDDRRKSLARRVSWAPTAHIRTFTPDKPTQEAQHAKALAQAQAEGLDFAEDEDDSYADDSASEPSMEMVGDEVTVAFASHFAGCNMPVSAVVGQDDEAPSDDEQRSESDSNGDSMEMANADEITSAFGQELGARPSMAGRPRPSEMRRQEDADDDAIMRELGLVKAKAASAAGAQPRSKGIMFAGVPSDDDEGPQMSEQAGGDDTTVADDTMPMDYTTAIGRVVTVAGEDAGAGESTHDEDSDDEDDEASIAMDLTGRTDVTSTNLMGLTSTNLLDATSTNLMDMTSMSLMEMKNPFVAVVSAPTPSTPLARQRMQAFARQVAAGLLPAEPSPIPASPRRVFYPGLQRMSIGYRSPGRALAIPPISTSKSTPLAPNSPARAQISVPSASKVTTGPVSPQKPMSPVKMAATPRSTAAVPLVLSAPRTIGGKSPGPQSLRSKLQEQKQTSAAARAPSFKSPVRVNWSASPVSSRRISTIQQTHDEDSTGSSFDSGNEAAAPVPKLTLIDFFKSTGTANMKDVIAMTGVDLTNRRKSVAPASFASRDEESGGPPSFADLAVTGGCMSLFYQMYQNDQARLQEQIIANVEFLTAIDERLEHDQPALFRQWQSATDEQRAALQVQFNMIKRHSHLAERIQWNECRTTNLDSIIDVMEHSLQGLRTDNAVIEEARIGSVIPDLQARREALLAELLAERQRDLELCACDQEELAQAHESLQEQAGEMDRLDGQHTQIASQLAGLVSRLNDLTDEVTLATRERDRLHRSLEDGRCFTKAEVFRLQAEYEALQRLSGWSLEQFSGTEVRLIHLGEVVVTLVLGQKHVEKADMELVPNNKRALGNDVPKFLLTKVQANVDWVLGSKETDAQSKRAKSILQRIASLWTSVRHIRHELQLVYLRYPMTSSYDAHHDVLRTAIEIHVASVRSTFYLVLEVTGEELFVEDDQGKSPIEMESVVAQVGSEVVVKFGKGIDTDTLKYIIREQLDQGGRGALLAACSDAETKYTR